MANELGIPPSDILVQHGDTDNTPFGLGTYGSRSTPVSGAAAALVACDALWGTGLSRDELAVIGARLGSDVPFLLHGGTALGTGHGEAVSPILARPTTWHWVVAVAERDTPPDRVWDELVAAPASRAGVL